MTASVLPHPVLATAWGEPFAQGFFVRALIVAIVAGALCGLLSGFVTLRGMSYLGHGLSHSVFGGAAIATAIPIAASGGIAGAIADQRLLLGAALWGLLTGIGIVTVSRRGLIGADTAIGVITTASFALGLVLKSVNRRVERNIEGSLFGSILGVDRADIITVVVVTALTAAFVVLAYRPLLFLTFDPQVAGVSGVRINVLDSALMLLLSLAVLATMKVLGVTLIAAMLVTPAAVARLLTDSFPRLLALGVVIGSVGAGVGMYVSYFTDTPSGATIVLVESAAFLAAFAVAGNRRRRLAGMHTH
jgi:ABC-type Mn2+/Zn2+ transport system permease subunit